jgi:hypothetical protein
LDAKEIIYSDDERVSEPTDPNTTSLLASDRQCAVIMPKEDLVAMKLGVRGRYKNKKTSMMDVSWKIV